MELTLSEYKKLWITKDQTLIEKSGMDKDQSSYINDECKYITRYIIFKDKLNGINPVPGSNRGSSGGLP